MSDLSPSQKSCIHAIECVGAALQTLAIVSKYGDADGLPSLVSHVKAKLMLALDEVRKIEEEADKASQSRLAKFPNRETV